MKESSLGSGAMTERPARIPGGPGRARSQAGGPERTGEPNRQSAPVPRRNGLREPRRSGSGPRHDDGAACANRGAPGRARATTTERPARTAALRVGPAPRRRSGLREPRRSGSGPRHDDGAACANHGAPARARCHDDGVACANHGAPARARCHDDGVACASPGHYRSASVPRPGGLRKPPTFRFAPGATMTERPARIPGSPVDPGFHPMPVHPGRLGQRAHDARAISMTQSANRGVVTP